MFVREWSEAVSLLAVVLVAASFAAAAARRGPGAAAGLQWVWSAEKTDPTDAVPVGTRHFRRTFELPKGKQLRRAMLSIVVDNACAVYANGRPCGRAQGWRSARTIPIGRFLRRGRNVLAIAATNIGEAPNPAGLAGLLRVSFADGSEPLVLPIDATWRVSRRSAAGWNQPDFDDSAWAAARPVAPIGSAPWGLIRGLPAGAGQALPRFLVPGFEKPMSTLGELFELHYRGSGPKATLWDGWLALASLWPATASRRQFVAAWRRTLRGRKIDAEGYVATHQHRGLAHQDGWPFPLWTQVGGKGWHFSTVGQPFGVPRLKSADGWQLDGARSLGVEAKRGWRLKLTAPDATVTTPPLKVDPFVAPFIRLGWFPAKLPSSAKLDLEWTTAADPEFAPSRRIAAAVPKAGDRLVFTHVPAYRHPGWTGAITRLRLRLTGAAGAEVAVQSLITAVDSRHNINNSVYLQGCDDYLRWTGDVAFLRENANRMRLALHYATEEFQVGKHKCIFTPWVGHDGRSGIEIRPGGRKVVHPGRGVGNNYWDLLPFGGRDALATIYYYDAVNRLAGIEQQIGAHPEWKVPDGPHRRSAAELRRLAAEVKAAAGKLFWNAETGRFVAAIDGTGKAWDYGLTFVNCEAIYYGFATDRQARSIVDWLGGRRIVRGDTSQGRDIYHWRFAPRATTRRNVEYYVSCWHAPESVPWGGQVQDGGAVLGFSYHDLMARLATRGPDDAWGRLREIIKWFDEIQAAGGYREYYKVPGRGTLQGGGTAGGLGLDREFFESVLVPQVMLYGFLGFRPRLDGFALEPRLPTDWPELTVTDIAFHRQVFTITASGGGARIRCVAGGPEEGKRLFLRAGRWALRTLDAEGKQVGTSEAVSIAPGGGTALRLRPGEVLELKRQAR